MSFITFDLVKFPFISALQLILSILCINSRVLLSNLNIQVKLVVVV